MRRIILLAACVSVAAQQAFGVVVSEKRQTSIRGNVEFLAVQQPSLYRDERLMYRGTYRTHFDDIKYLRLDSSLQAAPDFQKKSKRVQIDQDFYAISAIAAIEYTKLFRFSAGLGPVFNYGRSTTSIGSESKSANFLDYGYLLRGDIDYAFNEDFEANFDLGLQSRTRADKIDWSYGFGFAMNL